MAEILSLKPEDEKRLHPEAAKWLNNWMAEIESEVPLQELSDDDLNTLLSDDERRDFIRYKDEITGGLARCINMDEASAIIGLSLGAFKLDSLLPMWNIKSLLKKAYNRKEEEQRKREREKRWHVAGEAVNPPINEAKRYLNDEEYDKFIQAALEAIEVYLKKGEDYLDDVGTFEYRWWLEKIKGRKEEERRQIAAKLEAQGYNQRLNKEKARLKALLCPTTKDPESYFKKEIEDCRYTGQSFHQFLSSEEEHAFDRTIVDIGTRKLDEIISSDFRQFIDGKCWRSYFLLPSAEYNLEGLPCLDFMFDVFAIVEVRVWLKPGQKNFGGYVSNLPWREEGGYSVVLQEPEFLGYHYLVLTPKDLDGYSFWQSIPLVLLKGLLNGETKPNGTTISATSDDMITYKIPKFKEEVVIPDSLAGYLKNIGNIDQMVSIGIITEKVGSIVKSELGEVKIEHEASPLEDRIKRKGTKKVKAFQLFSEGKGPTSPELKALAMHKSTRFKYYNQYLAVHKP